MDDAPRHLAPAERQRRTATLVAVGLLAAGGVAAAAFTHSAEGPDQAEAVTVAVSSTTVGPTTTSPAPGRGALGSGEAITIAFVGDMNFEGVLRGRLDADPATAVGPFAEILRRADLAVGNLETAIAVGGDRADKQFAFRAPPRAIDALRAAGLDVVTMANNHGLDYGTAGLEESLAVARAQPDHFIVGIGADDADAFSPFTTIVKGQRVAVIGATQVLDDKLIQPWTATADHGGVASAKRVDRLVAEVERARASSDTVVVFLHWGVEKATCPTASQQSLAERLAKAGADLIIGSHAHRLQGGGRLGDAVVHYGLGNFLFHAGSVEGARAGVFEVTITGRRVDSYRWVPGRISGSVPRPLSGAEAEAERSYWDSLRDCTGLAA